jgi:hypothetical protein
MTNCLAVKKFHHIFPTSPILNPLLRRDLVRTGVQGWFAAGEMKGPVDLS